MDYIGDSLFIDTIGGAAPTADGDIRWDIASATYDGISRSLTFEGSNHRGLSFSADGTKMYTSDITADKVFQWGLATAWDLSTAAVAASRELSVSARDSTPQGVFVGNNDTKLYMIGSTNDKVYEYNITNGNVDTAVFVQDFSVQAQDVIPVDVSFSDDGERMFVMGAGSDTIYSYTLSNPWDLSTASYDSKSHSVSSEDIVPTAIALNPTGKELLVMGDVNNKVFKYDMSTEFDLSTASYSSASLTLSADTWYGARVGNNNTKLYIMSNDAVYQYSLPAL